MTVLRDPPCDEAVTVSSDPLTHVTASGEAQMVDVTAKMESFRQARASARVLMRPETLEKVVACAHAKGDVLAVARIAGIQAAKKCSDLIPLCHPLALSAITVTFDTGGRGSSTPSSDEVAALTIEAMVKVKGVTGVEMEALTAVSVAALTVYDMCKAVDPHMKIMDIQVLGKKGGKADWGCV